MSDKTSSGSFRITSDRDYRRGVILGLTLAEVLLLLIFLLLLATGAIMARVQLYATEANKRADQLARGIGLFLEAAKQSGSKITTPDEVAAIIQRAAMVKELESALSAAHAETQRLERMHSDDLAALLAARQNGERIGSELAAAQRELQAKRDAIAELTAAAAVSAMGEKLVLELKKALPGGLSNHPDQDVANMIGQYVQAMQELRRLKGNGSGLPYCWNSAAGQPVYMLRFELRDDGFLVHDLEPRPHAEDPAWGLLNGLPRERPFYGEQLSGFVAPLVAEATRRQCRYAVVALDRTGATSKSIYKHLGYLLDQAFAISWLH